jgi:hypothetical protein
MVTTMYGGRLGNNMFQYAAAYIFAKKHGFYLETPAETGGNLNGWEFYNNFGEFFKIDTNTGTRKYLEPEYPLFLIYDNDLMTLLSQERVHDAHYVFGDWFQNTDFVVKYREDLRKVFNPVYKPRDPDELFVSVRLGDILGRKNVLSFDYYTQAIEMVKFSKGYISSDSMDHPWISELVRKYSLVPYYCEDPLVKLDFAKDFNKLVLSEGTYCWWMGALSNASTVICNNRHDKFAWHGNIFVYPEWTKLSVN